jgi:hypothetical protein
MDPSGSRTPRRPPDVAEVGSNPVEPAVVRTGALWLTAPKSRRLAVAGAYLVFDTPTICFGT